MMKIIMIIVLLATQFSGSTFTNLETMFNVKGDDANLKVAKYRLWWSCIRCRLKDLVCWRLTGSVFVIHLRLTANCSSLFSLLPSWWITGRNWPVSPVDTKKTSVFLWSGCLSIRVLSYFVLVFSWSNLTSSFKAKYCSNTNECNRPSLGGFLIPLLLWRMHGAMVE